jgi:DNA-binding CsgD family transcriptional regulator
MTTKQQKIAEALQLHPEKSNWAISRNMHRVNASDVQEVRDALATGEAPTPTPATVQPTGGAYNLRGKRVVSRRPAESAAKYIKRLPTGQGFDPKKLSQEWGMGEETIRKHARDMGCLKYVEISEDEWIALVMNPETAKQYSI